MPRDGNWPKPDDESLSLNRSSTRNLLAPDEYRRTIFVYVLGTVVVVLGGLYALWRMSVLSSFQAQAWAYMRERDERWEKHARDQSELAREILRRLPQR
jgi:hypothetical protein